jgi:tetratricopeptide (TPR) repeat protein
MNAAAACANRDLAQPGVMLVDLRREEASPLRQTVFSTDYRGKFQVRYRALQWLMVASMVFGCVAITAQTQSGPPHDPELDAATGKMNEFERAIKANPNDAVAKQNEAKTAIECGLIEQQNDRMEAALWLLLRAQYWTPENPELLRDIGVLEANLTLYTDAASTLSESLRLRPNEPQAVYALARVDMELGQMNAAEQEWLELLKVEPDNARARYGYGLVLQSLQRDEEARSQFEQSIQLDPHQAESYYRLGEIARRQQKPDEARKLYQEALSHDPAHGGALTGLAILDYEMKNYNQAESELEAAIKSTPNYYTAHYYRGLALARLGRKAEAEAEFAVAVQLSKNKDEQRKLVAHPYQPN